MSTGDVYAAIRKRYEAPAWALMFEVADATGARHTRWADAVAMGLWPSRGIHLHGMEVKVSRSDWIKERKNPAKAESVSKHCDYWWLVVSDGAIVQDGELPDTWGLLVLSGKGKLVTAREALKRTPEPLTPFFVAALLRSANAVTDRGQAELVRNAVWKSQKESDDKWKQAMERVGKEKLELQRQIQEFETAAGFRLNDYRRHVGEKAKLIRDVMNGNHDRDQKELTRIRQAAAEIIARIDEYAADNLSIQV